MASVVIRGKEYAATLAGYIPIVVGHFIRNLDTSIEFHLFN